MLGVCCITLFMNVSTEAMDSSYKYISGIFLSVKLLDKGLDFFANGICRSAPIRDRALGRYIRKNSFITDAAVSGAIPGYFRKSDFWKELGKFTKQAAEILTTSEFLYLIFHNKEEILSHLENICATSAITIDAIRFFMICIKNWNRFYAPRHPKILMHALIYDYLNNERDIIKSLEQEAEELWNFRMEEYENGRV